MARFPVWRSKKAGDVQRLALEPALEAWCGDDVVQCDRQLKPVLLGEEGIYVENTQLAHGWFLDGADKLSQIQVIALAPEVLEQVGEQDVFS